MEKIKKFSKLIFSEKGLNLSQLFNALLFKLLPKRESLIYDPLTLLIYVTDRCNFQCQFCPHHSQLAKEKYQYFHEPAPDFTFDNFKKLIDLLPNTIMITFAGVGEPLLNPELFDMADYATSKRMYSQLITNGVLLDDEKVERILKNPNFYSVSISLSAISPKEYGESFDGRPEMFEKVVSNIKNLVFQKRKMKHPLEIAISFVVSSKNFLKTKSFIKSAQELGVDRVTFLNLIDFGIPGFGEENQLYEKDKEIKEYFLFLKKIMKTVKIKVDLPILFSGKIEKKCQWFSKNLSVDGAGNIGGCGRVMNPSKEYGNVFKEGKGVWNNSYFRKMRRIYLGQNISLFECCQKCVENQC